MAAMVAMKRCVVAAAAVEAVEDIQAYCYVKTFFVAAAAEMIDEAVTHSFGYYWGDLGMWCSADICRLLTLLL